MITIPLEKRSVLKLGKNTSWDANLPSEKKNCEPRIIMKPINYDNDDNLNIKWLFFSAHKMCSTKSLISNCSMKRVSGRCFEKDLQ